jgi:hypothetical protein
MVVRFLSHESAALGHELGPQPFIADAAIPRR